MTSRTTTTGPSRSPETVGQAVTVRPFEPADEDAVHGFLRATRPDGRERAWLDWYRANPSVEHTPMAVVERDGDVIAALPFRPVRVRAGAHEAVAFGVDDVLTESDADASRLAARAMRGAIDYYAAAALDDRAPDDVDVVSGTDVDSDAARPFDVRPSFFFTLDVPEDQLTEDELDVQLTDDPLDEQLTAAATGADGPSNEDGSAEGPAAGPVVDWEQRSERVDYHHVQRPGAFLARRIPGPPGRAIGALATGVGRRLPRVRGRRASFDTEPYTVVRHTGVPAATLAACYETSRPADVHVAYDAAFYRWWFDRPGVERIRSYVVYRGSEVAAGLVAHRETGAADDVDAVRIGNVVPTAGDPDRPDAIAAGMDRLLAEHRDAAVVRLTNPLVPASVLGAFGFRRAERFPTSMLVDAPDAAVGVRATTPDYRSLVTRPIGEAAPSLWTLG